VIGVGRIEIADDHLKLLERIVLVELYLIILRCRFVGKEHRAPFDVKDTVRRTPGDRREHAACSTGEIRASTQPQVGALILPQTEDCEVIRSNVGWRRKTRCNEATGFVWHDKVEAPVRADVHGDKRLVIQLEGNGRVITVSQSSQ